MKMRYVLAAAAMLMGVGSAHMAVADTAPAPVVTGNVAAGQTASAACAACHGADGNSMAPTFPKLAGQHPSYIVKQLHNFKSHERADPDAAIMFGMAAPLDDPTINNLAVYFGSQTTSKGPAGDPAQMAKGRAIFLGGIADKSVPACAACHGPQAKGIAPLFPRLAGQQSMYLVKQLQYFRAGQRTNDPAKMMEMIAKNLDDNEIQAVAAYLQSL